MIKATELGDFDFDSFASESVDGENGVKNFKEKTSRQIVFVIDASNSMQGYKIGAINDCVNNITSKLKTIDRNPNSPVQISALGFSSKLFRWTNSFVRALEFNYSYVEMVDGLSNINTVFSELTELTRNSMSKDAKKFVVLFSDGLFTEEISCSMNEWSQTELFPEIVKITVAFDDDLQDPQSSDFFSKFSDSGLIVPISEQEQLLSILLS